MEKQSAYKTQSVQRRFTLFGNGLVVEKVPLVVHPRGQFLIIRQDPRHIKGTVFDLVLFQAFQHGEPRNSSGMPRLCSPWLLGLMVALLGIALDSTIVVIGGGAWKLPGSFP